MDRLSENLRRVRLTRRMSQAALARRVGLPQQVISKIERGERDIQSHAEIVSLARALGVDVMVLLARPRAFAPFREESAHV